MRYYRVLYKRGGRRAVEYLEAANRAEAMQKFMQMQKGVLLSLEETAEPLRLKIERLIQKYKNPIKNRPVNTELYIALLEQLSVMLDAGLPLNYALKEVAGNEKDPMLRAIFMQIYEDIESGRSLYESAKRFKRQLGTLSLSMFRLGEETGTLAQEVGHLAQIYQEILDNRRKFKKATRYPVFILVAMSIAFVVVTIMVIPQFEVFFKESKMELPLPTKFLLWLEHAVMDYGIFILVGSFAVLGLISYLYMKSEQVRFFLDRLLLKVFIIGKATYYAMISRFVYIFRVLNDAGIPMIDALDIAFDVVDNSYLKSRLVQVRSAIEEGKSLHQGFEQSGLFENMVLEMIRSGEIGGGLGRMLGKINKVYKDRFDYIVDNISTLIEPVLIAAIAGFVLTLALGIFLPMWNMVEVAG